MDQQQFMSPSQQQQQKNTSHGLKHAQKVHARQHKTTPMPKYEHPSTFEDSISPIPPYSYRAQDSRQEAQPQTAHTRQRQSRTTSNDPDAFETGYRPYGPYTQHTSQQQTFRARPAQPPFPWLRQQPLRKNRTLIIVLIVLGILALPVIIQVVGVLIGIFVAFVIGITLFVLFLIALFFILRLIFRHYWRSLWGH
jgi:cation transport ATPase